MKVNDLIETSKRAAGNKGIARKLRAAGQIPGNVYGPGIGEQVAVSVDPKLFDLKRRQYGVGHLFQLTVDGGTPIRVQLKEVQREPVKRTYTHIDFYALDMSKPVTIDVPIELVGKPKGLVNGGILSQLRRRIEVVCLPSALPEKLVADVTDLGVGDNLHAQDLTLPEGVKLTSTEEITIARVAPPSGKAVAADAAEEGAEASA